LSAEAHSSLKRQKLRRKAEFLINPAPCYFPLSSIIAAAGLNFGVRDGNQCIPRAISTGSAGHTLSRRMSGGPADSALMCECFLNGLLRRVIAPVATNC
jgi:hypothetical protein